MRITLLSFGPITDITGGREIRIEVAAKDTDELADALRQRFPALLEQPFVMAFDSELVSANTPLYPHCTVALLPPYSGG